MRSSSYRSRYQKSGKMSRLRRLFVYLYWRFWVLPRWNPALLGDVCPEKREDE